MKFRRSERVAQSSIRAVDAALPARTAEKLFDRHADISEQDWQDMMLALKEIETSDRPFADTEYSNLAMGIAVLFPERLDQVAFSNDYFTKQLEAMAKYAADEEWVYYSGTAWGLMLMYPERRDEIVSDESIFNRLLEELAKKDDVDEYAEIAFALKLLFPNRKDDYQLPDNYIDQVNSKIDECNDDHEAIQRVFAAILLQPERKSDLHINFEYAAQIRDVMLAAKGQDWITFSSIAFMLAVISADEVRFTEHGYEFTYRDALPEKERLPDRKIT